MNWLKKWFVNCLMNELSNPFQVLSGWWRALDKKKQIKDNTTLNIKCIDKREVSTRWAMIGVIKRMHGIRY
jgi:hypothetical protein